METIRTSKVEHEIVSVQYLGENFVFYVPVEKVGTKCKMAAEIYEWIFREIGYDIRTSPVVRINL